jgi:hypothetical protein
MAETQVPERLLALKESDPEQFRQLMLALSKITVRPHAGQQVVLDSPARFKVMNCGRRWGKTVLAAKIAVSKTRKPNQMIWWVAPQYRITKRGYEEVLKQLPPGVLAHDPPPSSNFDAGRAVILRFKNGTKMEFYSAERPEGMLGAAVDFAVLDEAAIMPMRIWNQIVSPTLIDHLGGALMISTPRGRNWFYKAWQRGQDPEQKEWDSWTFTTQDNPHLPEGEADRMAADMPRMEADQEIYAKWIAAGSSVFILEDRALQDAAVLDNHLVEDCPPMGHTVLGIDLARTNDYTVFYGARARDRRNCYFERMQAIAWEEQRRRIKRAVRTLMRNGASGVTLVVDEGNAGSVIVEDLEEAGFDVVGVNFTTHKANMVRLLANDLERGRAMILNDSEYGSVEFENYMLGITPGGRYTYSAPEGEHDDVVSAKLLQHWGLVNEGVPEVQLLNSDSLAPEADQTDDSNPWDEDDEDGDYSDLIDNAPLDDAQAAAFAIVLTDARTQPTPQELLLRRDVWF